MNPWKQDTRYSNGLLLVDVNLFLHFWKFNRFKLRLHKRQHFLIQKTDSSILEHSDSWDHLPHHMYLKFIVLYQYKLLTNYCHLQPHLQILFCLGSVLSQEFISSRYGDDAIYFRGVVLQSGISRGTLACHLIDSTCFRHLGLVCIDFVDSKTLYLRDVAI